MKLEHMNIEKVAQAIEADAGMALEGLRESLADMKAGNAARTTIIEIPFVVEARHRVGLSQSLFAQLLGVSVRTLQGWEQGKRNPTGAAQTLLRIAMRHPEILRELQAT